jgi:hypothetical protein
MLTLSGKSLGGKCNCTKWPPNHGLPLFGDHACAHILSPYILPLLVETQVLVALRSRAISRLQSMRDRFLAIWAHKLSDQCDVLFVRFHSPYIYEECWVFYPACDEWIVNRAVWSCAWSLDCRYPPKPRTGSSSRRRHRGEGFVSKKEPRPSDEIVVHGAL